MSETQEREVFERVVPIAVSEQGDGRTIDARLVPYGVQAMVADPPDFAPYTEEFVPGAFERQTRAPDRIKVWLNFEHQQGLGGIIGHGVELQERADGLYGSFRVHPGTDGDKALSLIEQGVLGGMSIEFASLNSRVVGGITKRLRAMVDKASLVMSGKEAYEGATVLAVREAPDDNGEEEPPAEPEPEPAVVARSDIDEILERIGVEQLLYRAVVRKPWNGAAARFTDEEYVRSCLIDRGGDAPPKERCSLPVLEPNGDLNANALGAAAGRLSQTRATSAQKAAAARKLMRYYRQAEMEAPPALRAIAAR